MILKIRFLFYCCIFFLFLFSRSSAQEFSNEKEIDFDIDWVEEDEKFQDKKTLYIKHADHIQTSQATDKAGYSHSRLSGNVFIIFEEKKIYADLMIIKLFNEKAEEIIATGNVLIESEKSITIGEKLFFYPNTKKGIIYQAETYNKPYFIRAESFKFSGEEKMIGSDMTFSTCEEQQPHYSIGAAKGWIYKNEQDFFLGFSIRAGEDPIFFFPFMHRSYYGTGLITSIGREDGSGWFVNNTYKTTGTGYTLKLMIDHYQKIGEHLGAEYTRTDTGFGNFTFKEAVIYDKHVKYDGSNFSNYFEEVPGQGPTSGRSLRYKTDNTYELNFLKLTNFNSTFKGHFYSHSDPFISSQYESRRFETFDAKKILFPEQGPSSLAGNFSSGTGTGKQMDFSLNNTIYGTSLNISGNWNYSMSKTDDPLYANNPYRPEYYKNYKSSVIWPSVTASRSFNLFDPLNLFKEQAQPQTQPSQGASQPQANVSTITWPWTLNTTASYKETLSYNQDLLNSDVIEKGLNLTLGLPFTYKFESFTFSAPLNLANNNIWRQSINYSSDTTAGTSIKSTDIHNDYTDLTITHPLNFEYKWLNSSLNWNFPLSTAYHYQKQKTSYALYDSFEQDRLNTYKTMTYNLANEIKYTTLTDYEYLETSIEAKISNIRSKKTLDRQVNSGENLNSNTYNYSAALSIMKSSFSLDFSDNFSDGVLEENKKGPLNLKIETKLIPNVTFTDTYVYDRYKKSSKSNTFNTVISVPAKLHLTPSLWLNSLSWNMTWSRDYVDFTNDRLDYSLSADFNVTKLWQVKVAAKGQNSKLYMYTNKVPQEQKRDFWDDFFRSLKFWGSVEEKQDTQFKMNSFGLEIIHDLHKWNASLSATFTPKQDRNGAFYFESLFLFTLTITDFSGFMSPPTIQKKFGGTTN